MDGLEMSDVSEHDIYVEEEFSGIRIENMIQCYVKIRKCKESLKEVLNDNGNDSAICDDAHLVNESDETNNNELAMKRPERYVKIKKFDASDDPLSLKQDMNENLRDCDGISITLNISPASSLPRYPSSATQAPLTALFLPAASSAQNLPTSTLKANPLDHAASVDKLVSGSQVPGHPPGSGADSDQTQLGQLLREDSVRNGMPSQPRKRMKLAPNMKPQTPTPSRPSLVRTPTIRFLSPGRSTVRPGNVTTTWTPSRGRLLLTKSRRLACQGQSLVQSDKYPFPGSLPVDSTDLPVGWRRFQYPYKSPGRSKSYYLCIQSSDGRKLRSQREVDDYIEKKKLDLNIQFRTRWVARTAHRVCTSTPNARKVTPALQVPKAGPPNDPRAVSPSPNVPRAGTHTPNITRAITPTPNVPPIYDRNTPPGTITPTTQRIATPTPRKSSGLSEESLSLLKSFFLPNPRLLRPIQEVIAAESSARLLPNRLTSSRNCRSALPVQKLSPLIQQAPPTSGESLQATLLPAQCSDSRLLPTSLSSSNASNCRPIVPSKKLPPLIQEVLPTTRQASPSSARLSQAPSSTPPSVILESYMEPSPPCPPVLPLPTLAKALATLGEKEEGSRNLVLFNLTDKEIKALNTLGLKEVGILG